ncbi:Uncharacterised protein [Vibrio cholerae]|nr:Uncharacterised protein [Vibrio cholerae]CSI72198.1 Uncharacterised protein [Vibrio cholerae]
MPIANVGSPAYPLYLVWLSAHRTLDLGKLHHSPLRFALVLEH